MGSQAEQLSTGEDADWEEDDEKLEMDEELELEFDGDEDDADEPAATPAGRRGGAWRLIEQASEQRMLRKSLEDFDDYVV